LIVATIGSKERKKLPVAFKYHITKALFIRLLTLSQEQLMKENGKME
jgi:hypothetical protein